jgi:iron complex transport system substrate-binding protein
MRRLVSRHGTQGRPEVGLYLGLVFVALLVTAATCYGAENPPSYDGGYTIRVVSQTVGTDELLLAIAKPEQVAALSHLARESIYSAVAAEATKYPQITLGDAETILRFHPTLVLVADYSRAELVEQVRRSGVPVLVFSRYATIDDAFANLRLLARQLDAGAPARAERVIAECRARMQFLQKKLEGVTPVRVIAPSTYGVIPGSDTTVQDICDHAGATNLATTLGHLRGHQQPPREQMLSWPIDKVILAGDSTESSLAPFLRLPPYEFLPAVKERRVALLEPYMLSTVSHHRIAAYERLARELHPEVFR